MTKKNSTEVLEQISVTNTAGGIWEEMFSSATHNQKMLTFYSGCTYRLRLLGPFIQGRRLFIEPSAKLSNKVSQAEIKGLVKGDEQLYLTVRDRVFNKSKCYTNATISTQKKGPKKRAGWDVSEAAKAKSLKTLPPYLQYHTSNPKSPKEKEYFAALKAIDSLYYMDLWQICLFSNVYVREASRTGFEIGGDRNYILTVNEPMAASLIKAIADRVPSEKILGSKISGLLAYDFSITRNGTGINTTYAISASEAINPLTESDITKVFKHGLLDIKSIVFDYNKKFSQERKHFVYRIRDNYRLSNDLMQELYKEDAAMKSEEYVKEVDENINYLPEESLESDYGNSITTLEI